MIMGPAFNYPITLVPIVRLSFLEINNLNFVGLFMFFVIGICLIVVHFTFSEPPSDDSKKDEVYIGCIFFNLLFYFFLKRRYCLSVQD